MIARHPLTGKEVRVIQTDASTWKEHKTLSFTQPSNADKLDTVFTKDSPIFLLQLEPISPRDLLQLSKKSLLVFLKKEAISEEDLPTFKAMRTTNIVFLEELQNIYPHMGPAWDGTVEDAAVLVAALVGYRRILGAWNQRAADLGLEKAPEPFQLWWVTQYYTPTGPKSQKRQKEIRTCLETNASSRMIDRIVLLNESKEPIPSNTLVPIEERVIGKRLSYADVIQAAATFPSNVVVAFANADICIDDASWRHLWDVNLENKFLALLRYDVPESGDVKKAAIFGPRADSQDTWVIRVADIQSRGAAKIAASLDFNFGRMGCDNAVALEMLRHRFTVINPCLTMKTWHFHASGARTYNKEDIVERPVLHYIHPSGFHDLQPILQLPKDVVLGRIKPALINRQIRGGGATNWISAHNKKLKSGDTPLKLANNNPFTPSEEFVLGLTNSFHTPGGLSFDRDQMFIGTSRRSQELWAESRTSAMTPTLACERGLVAPWPPGAESSREVYILKYLSKIMQLVPDVNKRDGWEFFCPEKKEIVDAMEVFKWSTLNLPVIKYEDDMILWCKESRVMPPSDNTCILSEDVAALRASMKGWRTDMITDMLHLVIVEDGELLDDTLVRRLEDVLAKAFKLRVVYPKNSSVHRMADVFAGAWGVICRGGLEACGWNWMLPPGAFVFEVFRGTAQPEGLEISAAAGLEHRFCVPLSPQGELEENAEKIFQEVWREEEAWKSSSSPEGDTLPLILMPCQKEGYFAHPGDSFREMARLWAKAGYCRVKNDPLATMVWWGSLGKDGVLLYDRDNHDWRLSAPLVERSSRLGLFGNPKPPSGNNKAWTYWPRRPELVEELVDSEKNTAPWSARKPGLVFLGGAENKVQEKRRPADWESACNEWSFVKGSKYPFTQTQYLEKLAEYRFGLCLPGYGFKCHREVECMAMGCVPVCASGVDMESYAVPPVEGTHYLRASSPEEARKVADAMDEETWTRMSQACKSWWKENSSCEGSFKLTKALIEKYSSIA